MALAFAQVKPQPRDAWGQFEVRMVDVTLDASYVNPGGYMITAAQLGFGANGLILFAILPEIAGYSLEWTPNAGFNSGKLSVRQNSAGSAPNAEVPTNAAGINGLIPRIVFLGYGNG